MFRLVLKAIGFVSLVPSVLIDERPLAYGEVAKARSLSIAACRAVRCATKLVCATEVEEGVERERGGGEGRGERVLRN